MKKRVVGQEDTNILNFYNPNNIVSKYLKQNFAKQQTQKSKCIEVNKIKKTDLNKELL